MGRSIRLSTTERRAEEEGERGVQVSPGRTKRNEDRTNWTIAESSREMLGEIAFVRSNEGRPRITRTRERLPSSGLGANAASHHHHHRHDRGVAASRNKTIKRCREEGSLRERQRIEEVEVEENERRGARFGKQREYVRS